MTTEQDRQAALAWFAVVYPWHDKAANEFPNGPTAVFRDQKVACWLAGFEAGQRAGAKMADGGVKSDETKS